MVLVFILVTHSEWMPITQFSRFSHIYYLGRLRKLTGFFFFFLHPVTSGLVTHLSVHFPALVYSTTCDVQVNLRPDFTEKTFGLRWSESYVCNGQTHTAGSIRFFSLQETPMPVWTQFCGRFPETSKPVQDLIIPRFFIIKWCHVWAKWEALLQCVICTLCGGWRRVGHMLPRTLATHSCTLFAYHLNGARDQSPCSTNRFALSGPPVLHGSSHSLAKQTRGKANE